MTLAFLCAFPPPPPHPIHLPPPPSRVNRRLQRHRTCPSVALLEDRQCAWVPGDPRRAGRWGRGGRGNRHVAPPGEVATKCQQIRRRAPAEWKSTGRCRRQTLIYSCPPPTKMVTKCIQNKERKKCSLPLLILKSSGKSINVKSSSSEAQHNTKTFHADGRRQRVSRPGSESCRSPRKKKALCE